MLLLSTFAIGGFYFAALGAGRHTNLAIAEYWRWWVVHLWVEGFFEVFATVIIAFMFVRLGLVNARAAGRASVLAASIFLGGGVIGTLHHLYFTGTPTIALALGSVFSALEVVPLMFLGFDAWENWKLSRATPWMQSYRWPIYFFIAVAFWNLVGAGLFGFMINPPIALYYMQGLNTTPVHGHTALFGVYGMLGMGLVLFTRQGAPPRRRVAGSRCSSSRSGRSTSAWRRWCCSACCRWACCRPGRVRRPGLLVRAQREFLHTPTMDTLRWLRVIGDTVFAAGIFVFVGTIARMTLRRAPRQHGRAEVSWPANVGVGGGAAAGAGRRRQRREPRAREGDARGRGHPGDARRDRGRRASRRSRATRPDCILLDIRMPGVGRHRRVRADARAARRRSRRDHLRDRAARRRDVRPRARAPAATTS